MTSVYTKQLTSKKSHMLCQTNIGGGGDFAGVYQTEDNRSGRRKSRQFLHFSICRRRVSVRVSVCVCRTPVLYQNG